MRLKLIACKVLTREISHFIAQSENYIDTTFIRRDYHDTPEILNRVLQEEIDKIDDNDDVYSHHHRYGSDDFDAILLGYGLCSNALVGLSSKKYKLVAPRGHDCITLYLGSKERYAKEFAARKGIYWYNKGWIENSLMPSKERYDAIYEKYVEDYGEENADFLMEMEQGWLKEYQNGIFVSLNLYDDRAEREKTKEWTDFLGWDYDEIDGDSALLRDFIAGNWTPDRFLVVPPGKSIQASFDKNIIRVDG